MIRPSLFLAGLPFLVLAGCNTPSPPTAAVSPPSEKPVKLHEAGLERVMGKTGTQLVALFGDADLDGHEGQSRRMQFVGPACILDAYLYPSKPTEEPVVTYLDARGPTGSDIDRASCIASLSRRSAAP